MGKTTCFISLGSNTDGTNYLEKARKELSQVFSDIQYGNVCSTLPIGMHNPSFFLNQVAVFHTFCSQCEVKELLKKVEFACADVPKDKSNERIYIDIDLLLFGKEIVKAKDLERKYVQEGIKALSEAVPL